MLLFYWYLYILLWFLALLGSDLKIKQQKKILAVYCSLWAFVFGFRRYDVGNDTPGYVAFFQNTGAGSNYGTVDNPFDSIEEGFWFISKIVNIFTANATVVFLLFGICIWYVIYKLYSNYSKTPLLSLLFMLTITANMFYTLQIAVRQAVSIIVIGFGILLIRKAGIAGVKDVKRNVSSLLGIALCAAPMAIHRTIGLLLIRKAGITGVKDVKRKMFALLGIVLCVASITIHRTTGMLVSILLLLYFVKLSKRVSYLLICSSTVIALLLSSFLSQIFDGLMIIIDGLSNENISLLGDRYVGDMDENNLSRGAILAWLLPTLLTIHLTKKKDINTFFFKVYIFTYVLHQFVQFSHMHIRLITLFLMIGFVVSVPRICKKMYNYYYLYLLIGLFYLVLDYGWLSNWDVKNDSALPYFFIWD